MAMTISEAATVGPGTIRFRLADDGSGGSYSLTAAEIRSSFASPLPQRLLRALTARATSLATLSAMRDIEVIWTAENASANQFRMTYAALSPPTLSFTGPGSSGAWNITVKAPHSLPL